LRQALIAALTALTLAVAAGFFLAPALFTQLRIVLPVAQVVYFGPLDSLYLHIRLAVTIGLVLSFPAMVACLIWFVGPGLRPGEKKLAIWAGLATTALFFAGTTYALFIALPPFLAFLMSFSTAEMTPFIAAEEYLSLVMSFVLYGGLAFQLPLVLFMLVNCDIASPGMIASQRKLLIGVLTGLTLFFSPGGDLAVQLLLALPLYLLFEAALAAAKMMRRNPISVRG